MYLLTKKFFSYIFELTGFGSQGLDFESQNQQKSKSWHPPILCLLWNRNIPFSPVSFAGPPTFSSGNTFCCIANIILLIIGLLSLVTACSLIINSLWIPRSILPPNLLSNVTRTSFRKKPASLPYNFPRDFISLRYWTFILELLTFPKDIPVME